MTKRHRPTPIKELLKTAVKELAADGKGRVCAEEIKEIWRRAAGRQASKHSSPAGITGNTLIINVDSSIWIYQLNLKKPQIEVNINKLMKTKKPLSVRLRAGEDS